MLKIAVYNQEGTQVKELELNSSIFGIEPNNQAIFDMVLLQRASWRQGTHKVKNRTEVKGGGKKPWRQKGTGRARHGSSKGPQWVGGGVVFAPKPRDFSQKINKKMRDAAFASAFSQKIAQNEVTILDKIELAEQKTKEVATMLNTFGLNKRVIIVTAENDPTVLRCANNIEKVSVAEVDLLNVCDIVENKDIVITVDAIKKIEEAYV